MINGLTLYRTNWSNLKQFVKQLLSQNIVGDYEETEACKRELNLKQQREHDDQPIVAIGTDYDSINEIVKKPKLAEETAEQHKVLSDEEYYIIFKMRDKNRFDEIQDTWQIRHRAFLLEEIDEESDLSSAPEFFSPERHALTLMETAPATPTRNQSLGKDPVEKLDLKNISLPSFNPGDEITEPLCILARLCSIFPRSTKAIIVGFLTSNSSLQSELITLPNEALVNFDLFEREMKKRFHANLMNQVQQFEMIHQQPDECFRHFHSRIERMWRSMRNMDKLAPISPSDSKLLCSKFIQGVSCKNQNFIKIQLAQKSSLSWSNIHTKAEVLQQATQIQSTEKNIAEIQAHEDDDNYDDYDENDYTEYNPYENQYDEGPRHNQYEKYYTEH